MKLIKLDSGRYRIEDESVAMEGLWNNIKETLVVDHGISPAQILRAIQSMEEKGHDAADFGVQGYFQFSYPTSLDRKVRAELRAIRAVRVEFHLAQAKQANGPEAKAAFDRLMNLYFSQDVDGNLLLLGDVSYAQQEEAA
jgi:hypothetical protein